MKKAFLWSMLCLMLCFFMSGCVIEDNHYSDLFLTSDDNGQIVEIGIDNKIVIELESKPSTGYSWKHSNADESFFYQDGDSIFTLDPDCLPMMVGCGGVETFTFRANRAGYGVIYLEYANSSDDEPARYFIVYVNVYRNDNRSSE